MINAETLCAKFHLYLQDMGNKILWQEFDYKQEPLNTITMIEIEYIDNLNKINIFTLYKRRYGQKVVTLKSGAVAGWQHKFNGVGVPLNITITFIDTDIYNIEVNIDINYNGECIKVILFADEYGEVIYKSEEYECESKTVCKAVGSIIENIRNRIEYIIEDE